MSDIIERIAAVLRQHMYESVHDHTFPDRLEGFSFESPDDKRWSETVAAAVVKELHTAEFGVIYEDGDGCKVPDEVMDDREEAYAVASERCQSCDHCRNTLPKHVVIRYTTEWVPEVPATANH